MAPTVSSSMVLTAVVFVAMLLASASGLLKTSSVAARRSLHNSALVLPGRACALAPLFDMRIKIQGTRNAYTNLRTNDVVLYGLDASVSRDDSKTRALGYYKGDSREIVPLCNREEAGTAEFFPDTTLNPIDAEELNSDGRLLRVISSDRRGSDCFIVEEYLDDDIYIPVRSTNVDLAPSTAAPSASGLTTHPSTLLELQEAVCASQLQLLKVQESLIQMQATLNKLISEGK